jgi:hypothetical protein
MGKIVRLTESDLVRLVTKVIKENDGYIPDDNDLDIAYNSENGKILYDFWRSDYNKSFVDLTYWLEDNGYGIFYDETWVPIDGLLYKFWEQHPEAEDEDELLNSRFVEWLDEHNLTIQKDDLS